MNRETKMLHFQIKATGITTSDDGQEFGQIECYGAIFNNIDQGNDRINKGAFTRTIQNSKARAQAREKKYILPILWQHDEKELIGGWYDLKEDNIGLLCNGEIALATQRGREYYALAKAGMSDQFSIIYDVPTGGAKYDKSGVRDLTEIRLFSIDVVTFAMNDETSLIGIKNLNGTLEYKSVCGDTSLPIGPRDEEWDGDEAKKQIFDYAQKDNGTFDIDKLKKCFMQLTGDPQLKGSWGYPFVYIKDGSPVINVHSIVEKVALMQGARNADPGEDKEGIKKNIEVLYTRINKKYPDDPELIPPWKDDGKSMNKPKQRKTLLEHYNEEMAEDLIRDWQDVFVCALTGAIFDAFTIGDQPEQDVSEALDAFKEIVLAKFVAPAIECDLSQYLADRDSGYNPAENTFHSGANDGYYSYMSRSTRNQQRKAGRAISAATQTMLDEHTKSLHGMAKKAKTDMQAHTNDMHDMIDDMAGKSLDLRSFKAGRAISATNAQQLHDMADKAMSIMQEHTKSVRSAANDLANRIQGSEAPLYADGEGVADDDQQEGKSLARLFSLRKSNNEGEIKEEDIIGALASLKAVRAK